MPEWIREARRLRSEGLSYGQVGERVGQTRGTVYYHLNQQHRVRARITCEGCGDEFGTYDPRRIYCSRECRAKWGPRPTLRPEVADKIARAKTTHGKRVGERHRQLEHAGFTLKAKGEDRCRNCGSGEWLNLHHAIPRSMWKAGILEPLNGIPLCVTCHMGWHERRVVIYRDVFTADEWACVSTADLLGQNVEAWLDDRYPVRLP